MKNLQELPKLRDSITYLYLEHAVIEQNDTAIVAIQKDGRIPIPIEQNDAAIIAIPKDGLPIPIAAMTCLLLGSGTSVTHAVFVQFVKMDVWRSGAAREPPDFMRPALERPEAQRICFARRRHAWMKRCICKRCGGCTRSGSRT